MYRILSQYWPRLLLILTPIVGLWFSLSLIHNKPLLSVMPAGPDDVFYWQQGRAFASTGFDGGYFVAADQPALAEWSHFYAWGIVTPVIYGLIGRVVGWPLYAIPLLHSLLLTFAVCVWVWATQPNRQQSLTGSALLALFPPVMLFAPTSMQEGFQQSLAILAAAGFIALWRHPQQRLIATGVGVLLVLMSLAKVTWAILFLPYFWMLRRPTTVTSWGLIGVATAIIAASAALWHRWTAAPYPYQIGTVADVGLFNVVFERVLTNLTALWSGHPLELHLRGLSIALMVASLWGVLRRRQDSRNWDRWLIGFTLFATFAMIITLYEVQFFRDYRVIASPLLMVLFVLSYTRPRWIWPVIISCIMLLPTTWDYYRETTTPHLAQRTVTQYQNWQAIWPEYVTYQPDAPSPWCNTVLVSPYYIFEGHGVLLALPAGIGMSLFTLEGGFTFPAKSAYVLLSDDMASMVAYQMRLERLRPAPQGMLYRNLDAACP